MGEQGIATLSDVKSLQELNLRNTPVTSKGIRHLVKLPQLRTLDLSSTRVDRSGLETLLECKSLEVLRLQAIWLTADDIRPLLEHSALKELDVSGTLLSPSEVEQCQRELDEKGSGLKLTQTYSPFTVDKTLPNCPVVRARLTVDQSAEQFSDSHVASLTKNLQLIDLDLGRTQITGPGLSELLPTSHHGIGVSAS